MSSQEIVDATQTPLDPDETSTQAPLSGTIDDNDDVDDERSDENEAPTRALSDETDTRNEFRLDEREEDEDDDSSVDAEEEDDEDDEVELK